MAQDTDVIVSSFRHSAPYINAHRNKTFVLMLGGEALDHENFQDIVSDIALLNSLGVKLVLVFGFRPQIDAALLARDLPSRFADNLRITDDQGLDVVKQVVGKLLIDIQATFSMGVVNSPMQGSRINVMSGNFMVAQPIGVRDGIDFCHTGKIRRVDTDSIRWQLNQGAIVVVPPIGYSITGEAFNLSAEEVATQVAIGLKADKIIGFCSNQGVLDDKDRVINEMLPSEAETRLTELTDSDSGTVRYLRAAIASCYAGVKRSHLVSYQESGALLKELFTRDGVGTQIVTESYEKVRDANIEDIGGILELIQPLEEKGILVKRSRELLESEIERFTVVERDGMIIGCAALYCFPENKMGELACVVSHPKYRRGSRGDSLVRHIEAQAIKMGLEKIYVLTTQSIHWFRERGFEPADIQDLPDKKQQMYNFQRNSKILIKSLTH
ncbi:amino-acid N-acetyltransferase [Motilimonas pumila]|uniref:Amino-acid acetyltransferase n=1 Tax=Motilimonas pumila TaxID=2303987 RepID=A0A418YB63_9GAMM|nr:amino-acid N-acetyltransferase [Motilimonas pumila]RJG40230.1 amino-acid N-acetyltransferase [Motilimonas pumila]